MVCNDKTNLIVNELLEKIDGTHEGRDHYGWFSSGIFFSIIILLVLIVVAFACLLGLIGGILLIAGKRVYICSDTEDPDGRELRINHCIPLTKESGAYILRTLEQ